jgi:pilus assembly protein Flp/PilA
MSTNPARVFQFRALSFLDQDLIRPRIAAGETKMKMPIRTFVQDDFGATAIEYALIGSLIAMVIITGLTNIGLKLSDYFSEVSSALK